MFILQYKELIILRLFDETVKIPLAPASGDIIDTVVETPPGQIIMYVSDLHKLLVAMKESPYIIVRVQRRSGE